MTKTAKLFCLPYAGGSAKTFARFRRYLDAHIDIVPMDPAGHGERIDEPPVPSYTAMADDLFSRIREKLLPSAKSFAFFGHSMGASLAFLIMERLSAAGLPAPFHLFVSGSTGPAVSPEFKDVYRLPDDAFLKKLIALGGTRQAHLTPPSLIELFLPVLRSDFRAASEFEIDTDGLSLEVPVTVFLGEDDLITKGQEVVWQRIAPDRSERHDFSGGHFFFLDHLGPIADVINRKCRR